MSISEGTVGRILIGLPTGDYAAKNASLGVFGGKYMRAARACSRKVVCKAKLCPERHDPELNYFGVNASQPLSVWRKNGWLYEEDPRGWFQWYCRYYLGRRCVDDERQIKRWRAVSRHVAQIRKNCPAGALDCRPKQRQALLHWAYDSAGCRMHA